MCWTHIIARTVNGQISTLTSTADFLTHDIARCCCVTHLDMQAAIKVSIVECTALQIRARMHMFSWQLEILAPIMQIYNINKTRLSMLMWGTWSSSPTATKRSAGHAISVQMGTCTPGQLLSQRGPKAVVALSAAAVKCVSTTAWLPGLPLLQLSGTMTPTRPQAACLRKVVVWSAGTVMCVVMSGASHLTL